MAESSFSLKDDLFNQHTIERLAKCIKRAYEAFDADLFYQRMMDKLPELELKERITYSVSLYEELLTGDLFKDIEILRASLIGEEEEPHFIFGGHLEYVEKHTCNDEHVDLGLKMLEEMTQYFSAEFAIRPFINQYPDKSFDAMMAWSQSDNFHIRRLASEGFRPKLPWAKKINFDYKKAMLPLDNLFMDDERYVTRSVANHVNDISKMDPDHVIDTLKRWKESGLQEDKEMTYMIHHSLRTLIKKGHLPSLDLIGYKANPQIKILNLRTTTPHINIGESLIYDFEIEVLEDCKLMVDYVVDHPMANNKRSEKVFKIKKLDVKKGDRIPIHKVHPFKHMTTKKLYSGNYKVTLQINGMRLDTFEFKMRV